MTLYDFILANTDPKLVAQQMDMGNMLGAGGIAMDLLKKYPGRFELMHVKDEIKSDTGGGMDGYDSTIFRCRSDAGKGYRKRSQKIGRDFTIYYRTGILSGQRSV